MKTYSIIKSTWVRVQAIQLIEDHFNTHPHADHIKGVLYDPVKRIAHVGNPGFVTIVAKLGDWIISDGNILYVRSDHTFKAIYREAP